jgi:hypothetical protein
MNNLFLLEKVNVVRRYVAYYLTQYHVLFETYYTNAKHFK